MSTDYQEAVGEKLRRARRALGLSLIDVQDKSRGRWHQSVIGSYERGTRAVTVARLCELAEFYGVAVSSLLPEEDIPSVSQEERLAVAAELARDLARSLEMAGVPAPRAGQTS